MRVNFLQARCYSVNKLPGVEDFLCARGCDAGEIAGHDAVLDRAKRRDFEALCEIGESWSRVKLGALCERSGPCEN